MNEPSAEPKEQFDMLLDALKEFQSRFFNFGYTTFGLMVGALGWLISSKDARALFAESPAFRIASYIILFLCVAGFRMGAYRVLRLSRGISAELERLRYADKACYAHYELTSHAAFWFTIGHAFVAALIAYGIYLAPSLPSSKPESAGSHVSSSDFCCF
jgi:hypothetical protein